MCPVSASSSLTIKRYWPTHSVPAALYHALSNALCQPRVSTGHCIDALLRLGLADTCGVSPPSSRPHPSFLSTASTGGRESILPVPPSLKKQPRAVLYLLVYLLVYTSFCTGLLKPYCHAVLFVRTPNASVERRVSVGHMYQSPYALPQKHRSERRIDAGHVHQPPYALPW